MTDVYLNLINKIIRGRQNKFKNNLGRKEKHFILWKVVRKEVI